MMKINRRWVMPFVIVAMLAVSVVLYPSLPEVMPRQWGFDGEVSTTWPKEIAVLAMPALAVFVWVVTYIMPRLDPRRQNYEQFKPTYERMRIAIVVMMGGFHVLMLTQYDDPQMMMRLLMFGVALLLVVIGNEMGRIRPTWFFGIRTPWTLSDERVWRKTHRVAGRWFVGVGVVNMLLALLLPPTIIVIVIVGSAVALSIGATGYSYLIYQRLNG